MSARCAARGEGRCRGPIQRHHIIRQQVLRRHHSRAVYLVSAPGATVHDAIARLAAVKLSVLLADNRNLISICSEHHGQLHAGQIALPFAALPSGLREFADDYGMDWVLDDELERYAALARALTPATDADSGVDHRHDIRERQAEAESEIALQRLEER